jgi:hypothetical protein
MIFFMEDLLNDFSGEANRVQCFNHIVNLVTKSLLKLFDVMPARASAANADITDASIDAAEAALRELAHNLDLEDVRTQLGSFMAKGDDGCDDEDTVEDEIAKMTPGEAKVFHKSVLPVQRALVKVSCSPFQFYIQVKFLL